MKNYFKLKKVFCGLLILALVCLNIVGCGRQGTPVGIDKESVKEKIIRMTVAGTPKIDPATAIDNGSCAAIVNIYDSLVMPDYEGGIMPLVAKEWDVDEQGLNFTIYLNEGIKFHNGDELTSEDVVFSAERLLDIGEGFAYLFTDIIKEVSAVDDYTVKFTLKESFGPFISTLSRLYILNKNQVIENIDESGPYGEMGDYGKDWLLSNDAGSGPYTVKEVQQQSHVYAVKFDDYWRGWDDDAPDAIKLIDNTEGATVRTMIGNRELEISDMWQSTENIEAMSKIPGVSIASYSRGSIQNLMLNTKKPPTDDINFRKALAYLLDYDTIVDKVFIGSIKATGPVCHNTPGYNPNLTEYYFNLDKASEYLAKSKYADKLDEYPVEFVLTAEVADHEKVALSLQSTAQKLGIKVNVSKAPWVSLTDQLTSLESTPNICCIDVPTHYNEAGAMLETRYHSKSAGTWEQAEWVQNGELDDMIEKALATIDKNDRFEQYNLIQEMVVDEICPTVWLVELYDRSAYQSDYVYWPAAELEKKGQVLNTLMGYHFYFYDCKIYPDKMN